MYATRAGQWHLYLETVRATLPWFFAYDRPNYSRYLPAHYKDLLTLESDFHDVHAEFLNGNFSFQLSNTNHFGRMEADKVIETTINRDTKTPGGTNGKKSLNFNYVFISGSDNMKIMSKHYMAVMPRYATRFIVILRIFFFPVLGFSTNHGVVQRWTLTAAYRAQARKNMQEFLFLRSSTTHPDLLTSRIRRDQFDVLAVQDTITSMFINPIEEMELITLSSGVVPTDKVTSDLLDSELKGERELLKFQDERLKKQAINDYELLKKMKLGTFSTLFKKSVKVKANGKIVQFSTRYFRKNFIDPTTQTHQP